MGRRFGFARFVGVSDPKLFGIKLDNIIIGATKIYINAPRFEREVAPRRDFQQQKHWEKSYARKYGDGYQQYQGDEEAVRKSRPEGYAKKHGDGYQQYQWKEKKSEGDEEAV